MSEQKSGLFVSFEGGEGSGKSTQIKRLAARLEAEGHDVVVTREPGGSPGGEEIRNLLLNGEVDRWDGETEALLLFAARRDHVVRLIRPALVRGAVVLCDRFADSTLAYQGYGHQLDLDGLRALYAFALGDFKPDITLLLDQDVAVGLARSMNCKEDELRYENMQVAFHERMRKGFQELAVAEPDRFVTLDASRSIEAIGDDIYRIVTNALQKAV